MDVINMIGGGGLSSSALALANAAEADVVSGKTFYAGDKTLKTGTLVPYGYATGTWTLNATRITFTVPGKIVFVSAAYTAGSNGRVYLATVTPLMHSYANVFMSNTGYGHCNLPKGCIGTNSFSITTNEDNAALGYPGEYYVCYIPD